MEIKDGVLYRVTDEDIHFGQFTFPDDVKEIGDNAFKFCMSLVKIEIPNSVTKIGREAFFHCTSLIQIKLHNEIDSIGDDAFQFCKSLIEVEIPQGVTEISRGLFFGCELLKKIKLHSKINIIGMSAFAWCKSLVEIEIPDSVYKIEGHAFLNCESLVAIEIPDGVVTIDDGTFENCSSLESVKLSHRLIAILNNAFSQCKSLKNIGPLDKIIEVGDFAFAHCTSLEKVEVPRCEKLGAGAFENCDSLKVLVLSKIFKCFYDVTFKGCNNLELNIETSLFYFKYLLDSNFPYKLETRSITINGVRCDASKFNDDIRNIQMAELKNKIDECLHMNNVRKEKYFKLKRHKAFIDMVCDKLNSNDEHTPYGYDYDYRDDFVEYMKDFLKRLHIKDYIIPKEDEYITESEHIEYTEKSFSLNHDEKPEIITFDDEEQSSSLNTEVEQILNVTNTPNIVGENVGDETVKKVIPLNKLKNYDFNDIAAYANELGLSPWVDKLKQRISLCLLAINAPKECFKNIGITHVAFIREMLQCLSEDSNYDYKSAVDNYIKNYIETHKLQNVGNEKLNSSIDNQEIEPSKIENLTSENYRLKQRVAELEKELLIRKKSRK